MRKILLVAERSIRTARGYVYFTIYVALSRALLPVQTGNSLHPKIISRMLTAGLQELGFQNLKTILASVVMSMNSERKLARLDQMTPLEVSYCVLFSPKTQFGAWFLLLAKPPPIRHRFLSRVCSGRCMEFLSCNQRTKAAPVRYE